MNEPWATPNLSDSNLKTFVDEQNGLLTQICQNFRGMKTSSAETMERFAKTQIHDANVLNDTIAKIRRIGIFASDGETASQGYRAPAERLHEALRLIAEASHRESSSPTQDQGAEIFGLNPIH